MGKFKDLTGQKFGRLTAIEIVAKANRKAKTRTIWLFRCDCGNDIALNENAVKTGNTRSCGCLRKESAASKSAEANLLSQQSCFTHRHTGTRIYKIYKGIKQRCYNPKNPSYKYYGGKGIRMCAEWFNSPVAFFEWAEANGYSQLLTIDRIDSSGNYCPENCQFITQSEQAKKAVKERLKNLAALKNAAS